MESVSTTNVKVPFYRVEYALSESTTLVSIACEVVEIFKGEGSGDEFEAEFSSFSVLLLLHQSAMGI